MMIVETTTITIIEMIMKVMKKGKEMNKMRKTKIMNKIKIINKRDEKIQGRTDNK